MRALIQTLYHFLHDCFFNHLDTKFHITNALVALAVMTSAVVTLMQLFLRSGELYTLSCTINQVVVTIFTIEYILRLLVAPKMWRYAFSWQGLIDLAAILPFYLYLAGGFQSFGLLLSLRSLRFLKFLQVDEIHHDSLKQVNKQKHFGSLALRKDENLLFVVRRSSWIFLLEMLLSSFVLGMGMLSLSLIGNYLPGLILGLALIVLASLLCLRAWLNHHYDGIFITDQRLVIRDQDLFGSVQSEVPYEFIVDVIPDNRGLWNIIFQMGTIFIESGTPQDKIGFKYVRKPQSIVEIIQKARKSYLPLHLRAIQAV